ncbi:hypothetical protein HD806DRAFT_514593 [Xylariaceae sp. AK1471]|nr:hypothetical protein HD806DRAFT_514593 [Xylariaceae sp. AK1471]
MDHSKPTHNNDNMDTINITSPLSPRSVLTRSPLSNRSNLHVTNWEHKDSSEGQPSSHDSICDAAWISTSDLAKSPYQTTGRPVTPSLRPIDIDLDSESPLSRLETPFLYGYGTELAPILEQRSIATLRTKGSLSTSDLSSLMHDAPSKGVDNNASMHPRQLRRQHSFSLDDLSSSSKPRHGPKRPMAASSSPKLKYLTSSRPTVHIVDIHGYPRKPVYPPPQRPTTPPSLARFRLPHSEGEAYTAAGAFTAIAYQVPQFRQLRSGHGNLSTHPFMRQTATAANSSSAGPSSSERAPVRGRQRHGHKSTRAAPSARPNVQTNEHDDNPRPPHAHRTTCKKCRHARGESWSLSSTIAGAGPGMRRGSDWCSRCACRKIVRIWCCCGE